MARAKSEQNGRNTRRQRRSRPGQEAKTGKRRGGIDVDGIYRRRSLVTVEMDAFKGTLYARSEVQAIEAESPGFLGRAQKDLIEKHYVVSTKRFGSGGRWEVTVDDVHDNKTMILPDVVVKKIASHQDSIIKAQRSDNAEGRTPPRPQTDEPDGDGWPNSLTA